MKRKEPSKPAGNATFANSDLQHIEQLLKFMSEHNLEEFEYAKGDLKIRLKKPSATPVVAGRAVSAPEIIISGGYAAQPTASSGATSALPSGSSPGTHAQEARAAEDLHLVKSPIVGTYYGSPSPGAEPFVKVGGYIETGQTLCIVEAMKLMNEIESDMSGEVLRIFVENGQPVEYGQPLFGIRPSRKK
jgi:acetyl-CoA carboxylase biotin carboxyl carrier protein